MLPLHTTPAVCVCIGTEMAWAGPGSDLIDLRSPAPATASAIFAHPVDPDSSDDIGDIGDLLAATSKAQLVAGSYNLIDDIAFSPRKDQPASLTPGVTLPGRSKCKMHLKVQLPDKHACTRVAAAGLTAVFSLVPVQPRRLYT